jgi:single-strand DNA-binding protein
VSVLARGFNKVVIMGNLARDPEIRYTATKQAVAKLTVAVGHQYKGKSGEVVDQTDFIPVVVWGSQAENCERYLRKGRPVLVEGRLQVRSYETKEGEKRIATEVVSQNVVFLGGRRDEEASPGPISRPNGQMGSLRDEKAFEDFPMDISEVESGEDDADIPF